MPGVKVRGGKCSDPDWTLANFHLGIDGGFIEVNLRFDKRGRPSLSSQIMHHSWWFDLNDCEYCVWPNRQWTDSFCSRYSSYFKSSLSIVWLISPLSKRLRDFPHFMDWMICLLARLIAQNDVICEFSSTARMKQSAVPSSVTSSTSLTVFRKRLKTELSLRCFGSNYV